MKTTLLITSLNELEGMKAVLPAIDPDWVDEIIVMDGHSTDGSCEYAESLGFRVVHQKSRGLANSYREALEIAIGDVIIPFSPDGNSLPEKIPELVKKMQEGYDMVIVSRYLDGAKSEDDTWFTGFGNWLITRMINFCFGGRYTDSLVMFRAWKRSIVDDYPIDCTHAGFEPQLSIICAKNKMKIAEIPGDEPKRIHGERKTDAIAGGFAIMKLIFREMIQPTVTVAAPKQIKKAV